PLDGARRSVDRDPRNRLQRRARDDRVRDRVEGFRRARPGPRAGPGKRSGRRHRQWQLPDRGDARRAVQHPHDERDRRLDERQPHRPRGGRPSEGTPAARAHGPRNAAARRSPEVDARTVALWRADPAAGPRVLHPSEDHRRSRRPQRGEGARPARRCARPVPALERSEEDVTERGGLRAELLGGGIILTYLVCLVTTTTEGVHNLLFPLYLNHYGFALTLIGTLSSLLGVMR